MALLGSLETIVAQLARPEHFAAAYDYLRDALDPKGTAHARIRAVPEGETRRIELAGGAFALEQAYRTKPPADGRYEAHAAYIDLQAMVEGGERMDVMDAQHLRVAEDLLAERDVRFFVHAAGGSEWRVRAGEIAVFFPVDAHKPSLADSEPAFVRKTVVKVPVPA